MYFNASFVVLQKSYPMNSSSSKHFYLFKGDWYEKFIELTERQQRFTILEPQDRNKDHNLLIVYDAPLPEAYSLNNNIWRTDEKIFNSFYKNKIDQFNIHGNYNSATEIVSSPVPANQFSYTHS